MFSLSFILSLLAAVIPGLAWKLSPVTRMHNFKRIAMILAGLIVPPPVLGMAFVLGAVALHQRYFSSRSPRMEMERRRELMRVGRQLKSDGVSDKAALLTMAKEAVKMKAYRTTLLEVWKEMGLKSNLEMDEALRSYDSAVAREVRMEETQREKMMAREKARQERRAKRDVEKVITTESLEGDAEKVLEKMKELGRGMALQEQKPLQGLRNVFSIEERIRSGENAMLSMEMIRARLEELKRPDLANAFALSYALNTPFPERRTDILTKFPEEALPDSLKKSDKKDEKKETKEGAQKKADEGKEAQAPEEQADEAEAKRKQETVRETKSFATGKVGKTVRSKVSSERIKDVYNQNVSEERKIRREHPAEMTSRKAAKRPAGSGKKNNRKSGVRLT